MNLDISRSNASEYLKEFNKNIPTKKSLLIKKANVNLSKIYEISDKISMFYERGALVSPMLIDKNSIGVLKENIDLIKQFPQDLKPENIMETKILEQTRNSKNTRRILLPSIVENNSELLENYDKMVAYYLLMGGDKPIERFSRSRNVYETIRSATRYSEFL